MDELLLPLLEASGTLPLAEPLIDAELTGLLSEGSPERPPASPVEGGTGMADERKDFSRMTDFSLDSGPASC